jgi:hypothetical protein
MTNPPATDLLFSLRHVYPVYARAHLVLAEVNAVTKPLQRIVNGVTVFCWLPAILAHRRGIWVFRSQVGLKHAVVAR